MSGEASLGSSRRTGSGISATLQSGRLRVRAQAPVILPRIEHVQVFVRAEETAVITPPVRRHQEVADYRQRWAA